MTCHQGLAWILLIDWNKLDCDYDCWPDCLGLGKEKEEKRLRLSALS